MIPNIRTTGKFNLVSPFSLPDEVFTVLSIRTFEDCYREQFSVYEEIYAVMGLSTAVFQADADSGANVITLGNVDGVVIHVPSTYLTSVPSGDGVVYRDALLSVSLGLLPEHHDISNLVSAIEEICVSKLGVSADVTEHVLPSNGYLTETQARDLEVNRTANIQNPDSMAVEIMKLKQTIVELSESNRVMEEVLIDNSLL